MPGHVDRRQRSNGGFRQAECMNNLCTVPYYISSLEDVREFSIAARSHWGVENSLHWCLDVTFREDHSRMRKDNTAENFVVVRHIVLNILKRMDDKLSVARRRRRCCYDDDYLQKVLLSIHA